MAIPEFTRYILEFDVGRLVQNQSKSRQEFISQFGKRIEQRFRTKRGNTQKGAPLMTTGQRTHHGSGERGKDDR